MTSMFQDCINLEYINLKNFDDTKLNSIYDIFKNIPENCVICINESNYKIFSQIRNRINCYTIDCSKDWRNNQKKLVNEIDICFSTDNKTIKYKYEYEGKYYENCKYGILMNNSTIINCTCDNEKCISCPNEPLIDNLCSECNINFYRKENDTLYLNKYFNCYKELKGYYLDLIDKLYKKCFYTCETCQIKGDVINHNCTECNNKYPNKINKNGFFNCYLNCEHYYYFDNENNYNCTLEFSCPYEYPNLILSKKECVNYNIDTYKTNEIINIYNSLYQEQSQYMTSSFSNSFFKKELLTTTVNIINKSNTLINEEYLTTEFENNKKEDTNTETTDEIFFPSISIFNSNKLNENLKDENSYKIITEKTESNKYDISIDFKSRINNLLKNETKEMNEEINYYETILENIEAYFTSREYNKSKLEIEEEDEVIKAKRMNIIFTTTKNQEKNKNKNITTIDLGQCEYELKKFYNISSENILYIKQIEIFQKGVLQKIEFDIYYQINGINLEKLNISICKKKIYFSQFLF